MSQRYSQPKVPTFVRISHHDPTTFTQHLNDKYHCTFKNCTKLYVHRRQAEDHYYAHHLNEPQYYCSACSKTFSFREALQAHNKLTHGGDSSQSVTAINANQSSSHHGNSRSSTSSNNSPSLPVNNTNGNNNVSRHSNGNGMYDDHLQNLQLVRRNVPILPKPTNGLSSQSYNNMNNRPRVSQGRVINSGSLPPPPTLTPARNVGQLPSLRPSPYARVAQNGSNNSNSSTQVSNPIMSGHHTTIVTTPSSSLVPNSSGLRLILKLPDGSGRQHSSQDSSLELQTQQSREPLVPTRHPQVCKYNCGFFLSSALLNLHYAACHEGEAEPTESAEMDEPEEEEVVEEYIDNDVGDQIFDGVDEEEDEENDDTNEVETFHFEGEDDHWTLLNEGIKSE